MDRPVLRVGEPLRAFLVLADFEPILDLSMKRLYALEAKGDLAFLEALPRVGGRVRYSGKKVQAWANGELDASGELHDAPAAPPSRYFGGGQKR